MPSTQPTGIPSARQQQVGLALSALSDVLGRRDPIAGTMQRQAMLQAQQKKAEQDRLLQELAQDPRYADQVRFIKAGLDPRLAAGTSVERKIIKGADGYNSVSYTHLTLPTTERV